MDIDLLGDQIISPILNLLKSVQDLHFKPVRIENFAPSIAEGGTMTLPMPVLDFNQMFYPGANFDA
jgi:hypothetical protein